MFAEKIGAHGFEYASLQIDNDGEGWISLRAARRTPSPRLSAETV